MTSNAKGKTMKKLALLCLAIMLVPCLAWSATLPSLNQSGLNAMIEKNRGKVIMINFFATWCPPCRAEIPEIVKLRESYPDSKLIIIGLSVDEDKSKVPPFIQNLKVNYPVYMADMDVTQAYNVSSVPHNAFIAPDGRLIISEPGMAETSVLKQVVTDLLKTN